METEQVLFCRGHVADWSTMVEKLIGRDSPWQPGSPGTLSSVSQS